jgi:hypothetical protein
MTSEELNKYIEIELQWLIYYSLTESRKQLDENSDIYQDLKEMAYSKKRMPLDKRCCPCVVTSDMEIDEYTDISNLRILNINIRGINKYSPIETFFKLYPDRKMEIINKLKEDNDGQYNIVHYFQ